MENLWESYKSGAWVEPFLLYSITIFAAVGFMLFMFIIVIRSEKIDRRKMYIEYEKVIEKMFMSVVFEDLSYKAIKEDSYYNAALSDRNFRRQMLKMLINLHHNYEGTYAKKLEVFYFESGLMAVSFKKLKSKKWQVVCSGAQELAEMRVTKALPMLVKISKSRNKIVKIIAIKACAALNGQNGILHLKDHKDPIDLWTQVNIIDAFKRNYVEDNEDVELLLTSQNSSIVSLGLKIIYTLELANRAPYVKELAEHAPNDAIRLEAQDVLHFLNTQTERL